MAKKTTTDNKRRRGDEDGDANPKINKQKKSDGTTTPPPASVPAKTSAAASTVPPPAPHTQHAKVDASSAVQNLPRPPISTTPPKDDLVPPPFSALQNNNKKNGQSAAASPKKSPLKRSPETEEDASYYEDGDAPSPYRSKVSWILLGCLLFALAGSFGFVHQRIVQDLKTQAMNYLINLEYTQEKLDLLNDERNRLQEDLGSVDLELKHLQSHVRELSKRQLIAKFGDGGGTFKYDVELALEFYGDENLEYITLELDGDSMPHAVYTFLSQVDYGLFQNGGFAFHHNAYHVVFGSPMGNHVNPDHDASWESWENSGFARLAFPEYSANVPHVPYSVGFSGQGPNLYFNVHDNTRFHENKDPCFGRVSRNERTVDLIHGMSGELQEGDWKEIQPGFVVIRSAVIIL